MQAEPSEKWSHLWRHCLVDKLIWPLQLFFVIHMLLQHICLQSCKQIQLASPSFPPVTGLPLHASFPTRATSALVRPRLHSASHDRKKTGVPTGKALLERVFWLFYSVLFYLIDLGGIFVGFLLFLSLPSPHHLWGRWFLKQRKRPQQFDRVKSVLTSDTNYAPCHLSSTFTPENWRDTNACSRVHKPSFFVTPDATQTHLIFLPDVLQYCEVIL